MSPDNTKKNIQNRKRVIVIGAGAAGMACADQLSLPENRDKYDVTLVDVSYSLPQVSHLRGEDGFMSGKSREFEESWIISSISLIA